MIKTINLSQKRGFVIHPDKNKFIPGKMVEYLGFIIDSEKKVTYLLDQKKKKKVMRNFTSFQRITIYTDALFEG